jgi:thiosulfate/3-mercaptopyruvate sulfurtransferase
MIEPFVSARWVADHLEDVVLADVRWYLDGRSGRAAYDEGHIPGAVFVDLDEVLAAPASAAEGRHPLPAPETFAAGVGALGIGDPDTVVAYDDAGGTVAARLAWMLRATGHAAAVLDGGLDAWDGPLELTAAVRAPAWFEPRPWPPALIATIDEVAEASDGPTRGSEVLIDGRDRLRFAGGPDPIDPRSGHIPGAASLPATETLGDEGRLLDGQELRRRFRAVGVEPGTAVISYCGSGVSSCHSLLALEHAGLGSGRLFPGSWSQWSRDGDRPVATGE